jgi:solute carrier family 35 (UDP-galactose transporter), member B1
MYRQLFLCVVGIYICFLTWGITQERVSTTEYGGRKFKYFVFLNTFQAFASAVVAFFFILIKGEQLEKLSNSLTLSFVKLSLLASTASPLGYASLKHISYPTMILGKSCKLVPVVIMNFVLYRKIFPLKTYLVVTLITIGVAGFMFFDPKKKASSSKSSSLFGLSLLLMNLLIDGTINSTQDQIFKKTKLKGTSMMFYMNLFSSIIMVFYLMANPYSTELRDALEFCSREPAVILDILLFSLAGAFGQCFIFITLEAYGSLVLVTVTVTRKMFSIILSVIWFGHNLNMAQWSSVGIVFIAIIWEALGKKHNKPKEEEVKLDSKIKLD